MLDSRFSATKGLHGGETTAREARDKPAGGGRLFLLLSLAAALAGCPQQRPPGTVTPTPTPGATATPTPVAHASLTPILCAPVNLAPEKPYPSLRKLTCNPAGGVCTGGGGDCGTNKCDEGNAIEHAVIAQELHGCPTAGYRAQDLGADPGSVLTSGGSQNIPVTTRVAKYLADRDPAWFQSYFAMQQAGQAPLFGSEEFGGYMAITTGNVLTVRHLAATNGHADLEAGSSWWLDQMWSHLALMAVPWRVTTACAWHVNGAGQDVHECSSTKDIAPPADRAYVSGALSDPSLDVFLKLALDDPSRAWPYSLDGNGSRSSTAVCAPFELWGVPHDGQGKVSLATLSIPPAEVGLTSARRQLLARFVASGGTCGLEEVLAQLTGNAACELSIIRTANGVTAWFGDSTGRHVEGCSTTKGGSWAACTIDGAKSECVSRATDDKHPEQTHVWRNGSQICEDSSMLPARCVPIVSGAVLYEIHWPKGGHVTRVH